MIIYQRINNFIFSNFQIFKFNIAGSVTVHESICAVSTKRSLPHHQSDTRIIAQYLDLESFYMKGCVIGFFKYSENEFFKEVMMYYY